MPAQPTSPREKSHKSQSNNTSIFECPRDIPNGIGIAIGGTETDFDVGSLYELRLHDYDNGGEVKKVGWENL